MLPLGASAQFFQPIPVPEIKKGKEVIIPKYRLEEKVEIPEVLFGTTTIKDYSQIDLDSMVDIDGKEVKLRSDLARESIDIPPAIRGLIERYDKRRTNLDRKLLIFESNRIKERQHLKRMYEFLIQKELIEEGLLPEDYFDKKRRKEIYNKDEVVIDLRTADYRIEEDMGDAIKINFDTTLVPLDAPTVEVLETRTWLDSLIDVVVSTKETLISYIRVAIAWAQGATPSEQALQYLLANQNDDGSFGTSTTQFISTIQTNKALGIVGQGTSTAATTSLAWLNFNISDNNDYLAQKVIRLAEGGEYTLDLAEFLAYNLDEETGGIPFDRGFEPDVVTSADTLRALYASNYQDSGANPDFTVSGIIIYLNNTQRFDGGWSDVEGGESSYIATAKVLSALAPYKTSTVTVGTQTIVVSDLINDAVAFLRPSQEVNGSWNNDLVATALVISSLAEVNINPVYGNESTSYIESLQELNGSFLNGNIYATALALEALGKKGEGGNIVLTDLEATSELRTGGGTSSYALHMSNTGTKPVSVGYLHAFVDGVYIKTWDLAQTGIVVDPGEDQIVSISYSSNWSLVDDVKFTYFYEPVGNDFDTGSWYTENFVYAPEQGGAAGAPIYMTARKETWYNGTEFEPAIFIHWAHKNDPLRSSYEIWMREEGTFPWTIFSSGSWQGFVRLNPVDEEKTYELLLCTISTNQTDSCFLFDHVVTTSSDPDAYTGSIGGKIVGSGVSTSNLEIAGPSVFTITSSTGTFSLGNVPNGATYAEVDEIPYEKVKTVFPVGVGTTTENILIYTRPIPDSVVPNIMNVDLDGVTNGKVPNKKKYTLYAYGSDNVGVETATFSYYNPGTAEWHPIGVAQAEPTSPNDSAILDWHVPETLLGTGFKVKAIMTDYAGNESIEMEFGPFEIIEGNAAPTLSFIEPNGQNDIADQSFTIKWLDNDPEDNALIELSYDNDIDPNNGETFISLEHEDDFLNQHEWDTNTIPNGQYYLHAKLNDGINGTVQVTSSYPVIISHATGTPFYHNTGSLTLIDSDGYGGNPGSYLSISDMNQTGLDVTGDITLEAWVNFSSHPTQNTQYGIVSKWHGPDEAYRFIYRRIGNDLNYAFRMDDGVQEVELLWQEVTPLNTWNHVAIVYDATTGTGELFINGASQGTQAGGRNTIADSTQDFIIGRDDTTGQGFFDGMIDDVRVWNDVRTPSEIDNNKSTQLGGNEQGLVGYWKFNGNAIGASMNANNLVESTSPAPIYQAEVPFGAPINYPPTISVLEPNGIDDTADALYMVTWVSDDPNDNAQINLYYDTNATGTDGILIVSGLSEDSDTSYIWDTQGVPDGDYYVYATASDGVNPVGIDYSSGVVTINHNLAPSISITQPDGTGDTANKKYLIEWVASDPDDDAQISLYYDTNNFGYDGVLIANGISENATSTYMWNTNPIANGTYYIHAAIKDLAHPTTTVYSIYPVTIQHGGGK